jgi:hypothetical protein
MMSISKTDYLLWRECAKNAWLKLHKPGVYYATELTEFEKSVIDAGNEVEGIARRLFTDGILVNGLENRSTTEDSSCVAPKNPRYARRFCAAFIEDM